MKLFDSKYFKKLVLASLLLAFVGSTFASYVTAPYNGFEKRPSNSREAQWLKKKFDEKEAVSLFTPENLKVLEPADFIDMDNLSPASLKAGREAFQQGRVVIVDSVVGNATRLGNPPGGKGAVEIAAGITFLDAKIIRLAVESQFIDYPIAQILWVSEENYNAVTELLESMEERLTKNPLLSKGIVKAVKNYLKEPRITLMAQSKLLPVIDEGGELTEAKFRNLGAGELIPTIFRSGASDMVNLRKDSLVIFSNIDFDAHYLDVVAASIEAGDPDLMQVHVPTTASGGSAYRFFENDGSSKILPLEEIEVPEEVLKKVKTLNTNTVVLQGSALDPKNYKGLPIPFEKKQYNDSILYLPKLSLSDIGKHSEVNSAVAIDNSSEHFFAGSKNTKLLREMGGQEVRFRIFRWEERLGTNFSKYISHKVRTVFTCYQAYKALL